ncbi:MAG: hypothetical protein ACI358_08120 [Candidatus Limimorpha sp.]
MSERQLYEIANDMNKVPAFLPEQAVNISSTTDTLAFTVQGMGSIKLRVCQRVPYSLVQLVPEGKTPFPFILSIKIASTGDKCRVMFEIDAQLNPLMSMMAKRPLQNLVDMMAQKASEL